MPQFGRRIASNAGSTWMTRTGYVALVEGSLRETAVQGKERHFFRLYLVTTALGDGLIEVPIAKGVLVASTPSSLLPGTGNA
jgi:hypothetical protein